MAVAPLPTVDFIDMRAELAAGNPREVSQRMVQELAANLQRRGTEHFVAERRGYQTVGMSALAASAEVPQLFRAAGLS